MSEQHETTIEKSNKLSLGFWIYLMTDCILFASLFASYAVLRNNTFGGPGASELFDLPYALVLTLILLVSSFTMGLAILSMYAHSKRQTLIWLGVTFGLGLTFIGLEIYEFLRLIQEGNSWIRSGFLSAYFTLVGMHGLHITAGLLWIAVMGIKILTSGLNEFVQKRMILLSMFWHFLDIVWIFIFTIVYLMGAARL